MTDQLKKTPDQESLVAPSNQIIAQDNQIVEKDFDIDGFLAKRKEFIVKVNDIMVKGADYHEIQGKKSLAKGGAEKIASIFGWQATFKKDVDVMDAFSEVKGLIAFTCNLEKSGGTVGQGRGAASLAKNAGDPNKTIKMAQKSAFIDAVLRSSGLSDFFTQDLEDMPADHVDKPSYAPTQPYSAPQKQATEIPPSPAQMTLIKSLCEQKGYNKEDIYDQGFQKLTGGKGGTASELIDWLLKAPKKDYLESLPVINREPADQIVLDKIADSI